MKAMKDNPVTREAENHTFTEIVDQVRRRLLQGAGGATLLSFFASPAAALARSLDDRGTTVSSLLAAFPRSIPTHSHDYVTVMDGYVVRAILPWGDPLLDFSAYWRPDASASAEEQARQIGDNHDGMHFFPFGPNVYDQGLLALNHEYTNYEYLFGKEYTEPWTREKAMKAINAHGVSIVHLQRDGQSGWRPVIPSKYNRRITGDSPMVLTGPAAGHPLLRTSADPTGTQVRGTLNNCANGFTPWGTYLTCEENFHNYFGGGSTDPMHQRYGIGKDGGYRWYEVIERFDLRREPNEPNRFGWVVEIDPFDPQSTPKKRTALGRFKHENAAVTIAPDGRVVVYMGDDERYEYLYRFVSHGRYDPGNPAANRDLLDSGDLYVARFTADPTPDGQRFRGQWILLDKERNPLLAAEARLPTQADVLIHARLAGDVVGATKMDRPEWVAIHPHRREVYVTLTNNNRRKASEVDAANPRAENLWGQILRWQENGGDPTADEFSWDLFVLAGNPLVYPRGDARAGSAAITKDNLFNSPDGLGFDAAGRLWILTDGSYSNAGPYQGMGNNQMLVADPDAGLIRRFLVGPSGCEITGLTWSNDGRTMFVNVQHPGEAEGHPRAPALPAGQDLATYLAAHPTAFSEWPHVQFRELGGGRPRSATLVIERADGAPVFAAR
ncbi:PhoX family phosphatase [Tepidiphilus sp. J10]|uniref:PhoX family protein n=1 Tax=Tepidiphilus sp. J10 TaxID=2502185 RepID=UPI00115F683A|nr:PhoX family phosphatase [Tepidiphilus sp. J10]